MSKKGIICKIHADYYFVLTDQGDFIRVGGFPPRGKWLGSTIVVPKARQWPLIASLAAALALMVMSAVMIWGSWQPAADNLLALEVNPGVELAYDDGYQLTGWHGLNQEGQQLLDFLSLNKGENLYVSLSRIIDRLGEQDLLADGILLVTSGGLRPDEDLLLGVLEGRGVDFELIWLALDRDDYDSSEESPLVNYLRRLADDRGETPDLSNHQKVADAARAMAPGGLVAHQARGWFEDPVVQHLVGEFGISHSAVSWLKEQGFEDEEIAGIARQARAQGLSPRELAQYYGQDRETPLLDDAERDGLAFVVERQSVLEYLGEQFGHSPGQLTSLLARGFSTEEISVLLLLEQQSGIMLNQLLRELKPLDNIDELVDIYSGSENIPPRKDEVEEKIGRIDRSPHREAAREVAREYGFPPGQAMRLLAEGYTLDEVEEVMAIATAAGLPLQQVVDMLSEGASVDDLWKEFDLDPDEYQDYGPPGGVPGGQNNGR